MRSDSSPRDDTRVEQRRVFLVDGVPVDARHRGRPEVIALQAPHFAQDLAPLGARLDRGAHAIEIDPAALARRRVRLRRRIARVVLAVGRNRRAAACRRARRASGDRSRARSVRPSRSASPSQRVEIEELEPSRPFLVAAASVRADDGHHGPDRPCGRRQPRSGRTCSRPRGTPRTRRAMPSRSTRTVPASACSCRR